MVADFWSEYHVRLLDDPLTYKRFKAGLTGLLACDSRLSRWLEAQDDDDSKE